MMFDRLAHQFGNEIVDLFMVPLYLLKMTQLYYSYRPQSAFADPVPTDHSVERRKARLNRVMGGPLHIRVNGGSHLSVHLF